MSNPRHSSSQHPRYPRHRRYDPLGHLVRGIARQRAGHVAGGRLPESSPRDVHARLDALEHDVREVRTRINALFFAVLTAALVEAVVQLAGRVAL